MSNVQQGEVMNVRLNTVLSARLGSHEVWNMFDVSRGLWPDLGNYLCVEETSSMALNEGPSSSAENEDEERTGNNDEDDLDPEGKDADDSDGDWDSEDDELAHDDSAYGSAQAGFSREAHPELQSSILRPSMSSWSCSMKFALLCVRRPSLLGSPAPRY
ncbi:hypothetical protein BFJ68_g17740 [Fusarium oxysporum]|uniref:Uncharacterized protein n=1 Tax=Fusarium oxysporum TaxID=5507 RepID=A0A420NIS6_FUSOX|nr:hypothetical protein DER44DRAFT_103021 [Fusarium oxysporum]RKK80167.1 hypothetical protein BFJ68_g17740 [Fusarium oxysporum]